MFPSAFTANPLPRHHGPRAAFEDSSLFALPRARPGLERLLAEHESGSADHGNRLWLLLSAEVWYRMYLEGSSVADLEGQIQAQAA